MKFFKYTAAAAAILAMAGGVLAADRTLETDVVIVGAGAGGRRPPVASLDAGFKTVVLEKNAVRGRWRQLHGRDVCRRKPDAEGRQHRRRRPSGSSRRVMDFHHWRINGKALSAWLKETAATMDWLDAHGVHFEAVKTAFIDGNRTWHMYEGGHGSILISTFAKDVKAGAAIS